jgi:hypothetical protein
MLVNSCACSRLRGHPGLWIVTKVEQLEYRVWPMVRSCQDLAAQPRESSEYSHCSQLVDSCLDDYILIRAPIASRSSRGADVGTAVDQYICDDNLHEAAYLTNHSRFVLNTRISLPQDKRP